MDALLPILEQALKAWQTLRVSSPFPKRTDFDPLHFRGVLGKLSLLQVCRGPLRFRYCVHGTESAQTLGFDLTGKFFDEGKNEEWIAIGTRHLARVADTGLPSLERHFNLLADHRFINAEALVLPLSSNGYVVDFLISIVIPHARDPNWRAQPSRTEQLVLKEQGWEKMILLHGAKLAAATNS